MVDERTSAPGSISLGSRATIGGMLAPNVVVEVSSTTHGGLSLLVHLPGRGAMAKKTVEFDAHKEVKRPTEVAFTTKTGKAVDFEALKMVKVPVHVKFKATLKGK